MKTERTGVDSLLTAIPPVVWGSTYLVTTELLPPDRPLLAAVMRALPAGLLLVAYGRKLPEGHWWWKALILGFLNIGAFFYFLFVAAFHLPGGVAALVGSVQPLVVLILGVLVLNESIHRLQACACLLVVAGVALLVLTPAARLDAAGVLAGLAGAASMATGIILTKRWGRPPNVGLLGFTGWQLAFGGLILLPVLLAVEGLPERLTGANVAGFLYLGLIGAVVAYALWFRGIERLPAIAVSFLSFGSPLAAVVLGFVFLGQALSVLQLVGALVVIAAVILVQPRAKKPSPSVEVAARP